MVNSKDNKSYSGTSDTGSIGEALDAAIAAAKESIPTDFVQWKLLSIEGEHGGFIDKTLIKVTIAAAPVDSKEA